MRETGHGAVRQASLRQAEVTGGVGAFILGLGLGALGARFIGGAGLVITAVGAVLHSWGMWRKHRLERSGGAPELWWERSLYWLCWVSLAAVAAYLMTRAWR